MHAHTHTHKHTCISPLEVVDTTRDRYNIAHTHRFFSVGRCAPKSVYITSFFCFPMCRQIIYIWLFFYFSYALSTPLSRTEGPLDFSFSFGRAVQYSIISSSFGLPHATETLTRRPKQKRKKYCEIVVFRYYEP